MKTINIPNTLEAKTKHELRLKMRAINIALGRQLHYFDFSYAQNKWHCWYEVSESEEVDLSGNK